MVRRSKTFDERRQELIGALEMMSHALQNCEKSGKVYPLRVVAGQLRALVVKGNEQQHPLLIELAQERNFPLTVYTIPEIAVNNVISGLGPDLEFFSKGDALSLIQKPPYSEQITLQAALESKHILIDHEELSLTRVIRLVADTESAHYDLGRPEELDRLDQISIFGLPPEYRAIYSLGRLVCQLGFRFVEATI